MSDYDADFLDNASKVTQLDLDSRVAAQRLKVKPKQVKNEDGTWPDPDCVECGEEIGEKRLEATGSDLCIACASYLEEKGKQYARR